MKSPAVPAVLAAAYALAAAALSVAPPPLHVLWLVALAVSGGFAVVAAARVAP